MDAEQSLLRSRELAPQTAFSDDAAGQLIGTDETVQWTLTDHLNTVREIAQYNSQTDMTTVVSHLIWEVSRGVTWATNSLEALSAPNPAVDSLFRAIRLQPGG